MTTKQPKRRWRRVLIGAPSAIVGAVILFVIYLSTAGFPQWLLEEVSGQLNRGDYVINADAMKFDPLHGLLITNPRVYRKGTVGPAALEAGKLIITPDWGASDSERLALKKIRIEDGTVRPRMAFGPERKECGPGKAMESRIELINCRVQGVTIRELTCAYRCTESSVTIDKVRGIMERGGVAGPMEGALSFDTGSELVQGHVTTRMDPGILVPVFREWDLEGLAETVERFEFGEAAPDCTFDFSTQPGSNGTFRMNGRFRLEECSYNGARMLQGGGRVRVDLSETNNVLVIDPLYVFRADGIVRCGLTFDFDRDLITFEGSSGIGLRALADLIGVFPEDLFTHYRMDGPAKIAASGRVGCGTNDTLDIRGKLEGTRLGVGRHVADELSFYLHVDGRTNTLSGVKGTIYGGTFDGSMQFITGYGGDTNTLYNIEGTLRDIKLKQLFAALGVDDVEKHTGDMTLHIAVAGPLGPQASELLTGKGRFRIGEGKLFTLRIFGGMTDILTKIVPGLDFVLSQSDANGEFTIRHGKIHTDETRIEGVLSTTGRGDYYFDERLDFKVQVSLLKHKTLLGKTVGTLLSPLSWLLEFRLTGTLDEPRWYLRTFSRDLLKKLGLTSTDGAGK